MNYAQARKRQSNGRWDWTVRNDDQVWTSAPCSDHDDGHATAEDAERHFWEWEVSQPVRAFADPDVRRKCEVCQFFTDGRVLLYDGYELHVLCPEHQDRASIERVHPFVPGRSLIYS